jgi:hypothetical protein
VSDAEHSRLLTKLARIFLYFSCVKLDQQAWNQPALVQYEYRAAAMNALASMATVETFSAQERIRCMVQASLVNFVIHDQVKTKGAK